VEQKLAEAAEGAKVEDWKWVRHAPSFPFDETQKDGKVDTLYSEPSGEQQATIANLQANADSIMAAHGEEPEDEEAYSPLEALQEQIETL
jgi:hypothetical protein